MNNNNATFRASIAAAILIATSIASTAMGEPIIDLSIVGSEATLHDAQFFQIDPTFPVGTGNLRPFLQLQASGYERGYNTDGDPSTDVDMAINTGSWTHSLTLAQVSQATYEGGAYYEFFLDVNEAGKVKELLLSQIRIHAVANGATLTGYPQDVPGTNEPASYGAFGTPIWSLDTSTASYDIKLNADGGSGDGDMLMLIPASVFSGITNENIILYSRFDNTSDGFEEWSVSETPMLPEPATMSLLLVGGLGLLARHGKRQAA